jgi:hypothetical protein
VLYDLMELAANEHASVEVRAIAAFKLSELHGWLQAPSAAGLPGFDRAHLAFASWQIEQFEKDPKRIELTPPAEAPDGPPIGDDGDSWD